MWNAAEVVKNNPMLGKWLQKPKPRGMSVKRRKSVVERKQQALAPAARHFTTVSNGVNRKASHKRFIRSDGGATMVGHDLVGVMTITDSAEEADVVFTLSVNPVDLGFPALSEEAKLHQQYIFRNFEVHMASSAGEFVNGDMLGYFDRDPDEALPEGVEGLQVGYYKGGTTGAFKSGKTWRMPHFPDLPLLYTRDISSDARLVNQCDFNLQIVNPPSLYVSSADADAINLNIEVWASYHVDFRVNDITSLLDDAPVMNAFTVLDSIATTTATETDPLGLHNNGGAERYPHLTSSYSNNANWPGMLVTYDLGLSFLIGVKGFGTDAVKEFQVEFSGGIGTAPAVNEAGGIGGPNTAAGYSDMAYGGFLHGSDYGGLTPIASSFPNTATANLSAVWRAQCVVTTPGEAIGTLASIGLSDPDLGWVMSPNGLWVRPSELGIDGNTECLWYLDLAGASGKGVIFSANTGPTCVAIATSFASTVGITYGPATVEGLCTQKWQDLSTEERLEYKGELKNFIRATKRSMRPEKDKVNESLKSAWEQLAEQGESKATYQKLLGGLTVDAKAASTTPRSSPAEGKDGAKARPGSIDNWQVVEECKPLPQRPAAKKTSLKGTSLQPGAP